MRNRLFALAAMVGVFLLALGATLAWGGQASAEGPTPTPTPLPAECDIGVVAPGIVASVAGTPIAALTMMVGDPPAVLDVSATFKNLGAYTQGAPDETCSFTRVYAAEIGTGDILTDTPIDPTKLGVRVEPVGNPNPPYGDVCLQCSDANKALGWTAARCVQEGEGMLDYAPPPPPQSWDYVPMSCDEIPNPSGYPYPFSTLNESCENGIDDATSDEGTCDWAGFSKLCTTPTTPDPLCVDIPLINPVFFYHAVLAPDATNTSAREVKVECREPGAYPLVLLAGVGKTSTSVTPPGPYLGPKQDPNQANDTTATVVTVTCGSVPVGGIAENPQTEPPSASAARGPSGPNTLALAGVAAVVVAVAAGGWYARKRWRVRRET